MSIRLKDGFCLISQLIRDNRVISFTKLPKNDWLLSTICLWHLLSIRVRAAVLSGGGSCDGAFSTLSVCPAGGRTAAFPLWLLRLGSCTPWTAGPGSVPAFCPRSGLPAGVRDLRGEDTAETGQFNIRAVSTDSPRAGSAEPPEQSTAVAVSRAYSASVTCSVAMLWKKLSTGPTRSSLPPVHGDKQGKIRK